MDATPESYRDDKWAVYESWTGDRLSEIMPNAEARQWMRDAYAEGDTRSLYVGYAGRTFAE